MKIKRLLLAMVCLVCIMWCAAALADTPVCGTEGSKYAYCWSDGEQYYDDDFHWYICQHCGSEMEKYPHWSYCDGEGKCSHCFAPYFGDNVGNHYADCEWPDVCDGCGQTMEDLPIGSHGELPMSANATHHWETCEDCGRVVRKEAHFVRCDAEDKTVCNECDTVILSQVVYHQWAYEALENGMHQRTCESCGLTEQEAHWAICESLRTDICDGCGEIVESAMRHSTSGYIDFNADTHWMVCILCCDKMNVEAHYTNAGDPAGFCSHCGVATAKVTGQLVRLSDSAAYYDAPGGTAQFTYADLNAVKWTNLLDYYGEAVVSGGYTWYQVAEKGGMYYLRSDAVKVLDQPSGYVVTYGWQGLIRNEPAGNRVLKDVYYEEVLPYYGQPVQSVTADPWYLVVYNGIAGYIRGNEVAPCDSEGNVILQDPATCQHNFAAGGTAYLDDLYHVNTCFLCGAMDLESKYPHSAQCVATACDTCGAEGVTLSEVWHGDTTYIAVDKRQHSVFCLNCEQIVDTQNHYGYCDVGTCWDCHEQACELTAERALHREGQYVNLNAQFHAYVCINCDYYAPIDRSAHAAYCTAPDVCADCGEANPEKIDHRYWVYACDEENHWWSCEDCGEIVWEKEPHKSSCNDPNTCWVCEQPCDDSKIEYHSNVDKNTFYYDETSHWYLCTDCGGQAWKEEHRACCTLPGVCDICLMVYSGENIFHSINYDYSAGEMIWLDYEHHKYTCGWCGEYEEISEHWSDFDFIWCDACDGRRADMDVLLIIPDDVTVIAEQAFYGTTSIKDVILPEGVKTIESLAFANSSLKNINLPSSLTFIADDAFEGCTGFYNVLAQKGTYAHTWAKEHGLGDYLVDYDFMFE